MMQGFCSRHATRFASSGGATRIVILTPGNSEHGGVGTFVCQLHGLLAGNVSIVTGATESAGYYRNIPCWNISGFDRRPRLRSVLSVMKAIGTFRRATVICNGTAALLAALLLKLRFGKSLVIINVFHGLASRYEKRRRLIRTVEKLAGWVADKNVFLTSTDHRTLNCAGHVIPNAIQQGSSYSRSRKVQVPRNQLIVVARHSRQKNIDIVLLLASRLPCFRISVFGGGERFDSVRLAVERKALRNVRLKRWAELGEIYKPGAIFMLPTYAEGFPLSLLEAASRGLPLVLSDLPELQEICGEHAQYFSNDSVETLIRVVTTLTNDFEYRDWSRRAMKLSARYSYERWSTNWIELLEKCSI